jgi:regulatory protein
VDSEERTAEESVGLPRKDQGAAPEGMSRERQLEWAREIALRRLDQRDYTGGELRAVLLKRGCPPDVADDLLRGFEAAGLVNDARFAEAWVFSRHERRNLSHRVVAAELRRKGVAAELVVVATAGIDRNSELRAAREVAATRLRRLTGLEYAVAYRRLAGALGRRGYDPDVVAEVVKETLRDWVTSES